MSLRVISALVLGLATGVGCAGSLTPPASSDDLTNPHRGFMLWGTSVAADGGLPDNFYGSRVFHIYVPWREVEPADQQFDWDGFEQRHLQPILAELPDATFVLRPVADYPDGPASNISHFYTGGELERDYPKFLEQPPLSIGFTDYTDCGGDGPGRSPDYNAPAMRTQMQQLVAALAARYDHDARITAIQTGLLGFWGEWHTSGCPAMEPSEATRRFVHDAYTAHFSEAPLQTRYARPADSDSSLPLFFDDFEGAVPLRTHARASTLARGSFAFYEDYFPSFTALCSAYTPAWPLCDDGGWWNLGWSFANDNPGAHSNWKYHPMSGESPMASQRTVWNTRSADLIQLVRNERFTLLGPAGLHNSNGFAATLLPLKRALGYEFTVQNVQWPDAMSAGQPISVTLSVRNTGSAPLYRAYRVELHWLDSGGTVRARAPLAYPLDRLLPGPAYARAQTATVPSGIPAGTYSLRLAIVDATSTTRPGIVMQNGGRDAAGRLVLGNVTVN